MKIESIKHIRNCFLAFGIYFFMAFTSLHVLLLSLFGIDYLKLPDLIQQVTAIIYQIIICIIICLIFKNTIKNNFIEYRNNFKKYLPKCIKYWLIMYGLLILGNSIVLIFHSEIATNESNVRNVIEFAPIYSFFSAVIIAPILEETLFRLSIREIIRKNDWLFILISGIIFGSIHVLSYEIKVWTELLHLIPYSLTGILLSYSLVKQKNIFVPITIHMLNNGFAFIVQIISLLS